MKVPSILKDAFGELGALCGFPFITGVWMVIGFHVMRKVDLFGIYRTIRPDSAFTEELGYEFLRCVEMLFWFLPFAYGYIVLERKREKDQTEFGPKAVGMLFVVAGCLAFFGLLGVIGLNFLIVWPLEVLRFDKLADTAYWILAARDR